MTRLSPSMSDAPRRIHDPSWATPVRAANFPCSFAIQSTRSRVAGAGTRGPPAARAPAASSCYPAELPPGTSRGDSNPIAGVVPARAH